MRHHRRPIVTAVLTLLVTAGWLALLVARPDRAWESVRIANWQSATWYRLDGDGPIVECELPAGHHYRLVLGCLGEATQEHRASLQLTNSRDVFREKTISAPTIPLAPSGRGVRGEGLWDTASLANRPSPPATLPEGARGAKTKTLPLVESREFFLHVTDGDLGDPKQYARITTRHAASGSRVRVFVDQQHAKGEVPQSRIDELVCLLESDIVPRVESQFGSLADVDGDGGLAVVLTPWLSRLQGGRTSIGGMVRSSDFQRDLSPPFSNRCDMLFLNSSLPSESGLRDLLSHEVAHAACISQRLSRVSGTLRDEEDWLSEALAHLAEPGWSNLDHRLVAFLDNPSRFPLVVSDYYRAGLWRDPGCRGATYLFHRWCAGRETRLVRQLAQSSQRGMRNLERATGRRFEELFREWNLSLAEGAGLDSADLQSVLQRLGSDGVRPMVVDVRSGGQTLAIRGTAFAVIDLRVDESSSQILHIAGDSAARWQFSICRCPEDSRGRSDGSTLAAVRR